MSTIISEIFLVVGAAIGAFLVWQLVKGVKARKWPTVRGTVDESRVSMHTSYDEGRRSTTYGADILYHYEVDGSPYSGTRLSFSDYRSSNRRRAEQIVGRYSPGSVVQVYYSPDDPSESLLEPGVKPMFFLFLLLPLIFIVLGVLGLAGAFD